MQHDDKLTEVERYARQLRDGNSAACSQYVIQPDMHATGILNLGIADGQPEESSGISQCERHAPVQVFWDNDSGVVIAPDLPFMNSPHNRHGISLRDHSTDIPYLYRCIRYCQAFLCSPGLHSVTPMSRLRIRNLIMRPAYIQTRQHDCTWHLKPDSESLSLGECHSCKPKWMNA